MAPQRRVFVRRRSRRCSIIGCPSVSGRPLHRGVNFNKLPTNTIIRRYWLTNCGISVIPSRLLVCSRHFHRADFQSLKNKEYLLKEGAVPTIFPWGSFPYVEPTQTIIAANSKLPVVTASQFSVGARIKAQDFQGVWHFADVLEVDNDEVLIQFERNGESKVTVEWILKTSSRLRPFQILNVPVVTYMPGEKCLARWKDTRKSLATVQRLIENNTYEVLFHDGFVKVVKAVHMSKVKDAELVKQPPSYASSVAIENPHQPIPKYDSSKLNLLPVPKDGEWCCNWVNEIPVGVESYLICREGFKRPTLIVDDWRLPVGWTKHTYTRSIAQGKWDIVLVEPRGKCLRTKRDVEKYFQETDEVYNEHIADFSIHKRRAKDLGLYVFTDEYKKESKNRKLFAKKAKVQEIQLIDNLFSCTANGCNKNFRKENQLQSHIKHYHKELADQFGSCTDLAYQQKVRQPMEELIIKNEMDDGETRTIELKRFVLYI